MKKLVNMALMDRMDSMIRLKSTGRVKDFARRLGIPVSTLREYISYMQKMLNAPIRYDKYFPSFYYEYLPDFYLGFENDRTNPREQQEEE